MLEAFDFVGVGLGFGLGLGLVSIVDLVDLMLVLLDLTTYLVIGELWHVAPSICRDS